MSGCGGQSSGDAGAGAGCRCRRTREGDALCIRASRRISRAFLKLCLGRGAGTGTPCSPHKSFLSSSFLPYLSRPSSKLSAKNKAGSKRGTVGAASHTAYGTSCAELHLLPAQRSALCVSPCCWGPSPGTSSWLYSGCTGTAGAEGPARGEGGRQLQLCHMSCSSSTSHRHLGMTRTLSKVGKIQTSTEALPQHDGYRRRHSE